MEHISRVAESTTPEKGGNRLVTGLSERANDQASKDQPLQAWAVLVRDRIDDWENCDQRHIQLLTVLLDLTIKHPDQASKGFKTEELNEAIEKLLGHGVNPDKLSDSKRLTNYWRTLQKTWAQKQEGLRQRGADRGLPGIPDLDKTTGGGTGRPSVYRFTYKESPISDESETPSSNQTSSDEVRYYVDDQTNSGWAAKLLGLKTGYELSSWRKWLYLTVMLATVSSIGLLTWLFFLYIKTQTSIGAVTSLGLLLGAATWSIWKSVYPYFEVLDYKVTVAPSLFQAWGDKDDALLVFERNMPESPNRLLVTSYSGSCSICKGKLTVRKGGREFPNRLVGRCENSPREHVFSFDHYLRKGWNLIKQSG